VVLAVGLLAALAAAGFGWLLARAGDYDATLLERHRWLGTGFAGLALVLFLLRARPRAYAVALVTSLALLGAAGHVGGSLTHGSDFLTWADPGGPRPHLHGPRRGEGV
jgi:FtsH-binding integral membrane protein